MFLNNLFLLLIIYNKNKTINNYYLKRNNANKDF